MPDPRVLQLAQVLVDYSVAVQPGRGAVAGLTLMFGLWTQVLAADVVRIATYNPDLVRAGPGLLLQSIDRRNDDQIDAVVAIEDRRFFAQFGLDFRSVQK